MAPQQFEILAELRVDIQRAFGLLSTAEGMQQWIPGCRGVRIEHPDGGKRLAVGSVRYVTMGNGTTAVEQVVLLQAPQRMDYILVSTGTPLMDRLVQDYMGRVTLIPRGLGRCELQWAIHFQCKGLMRPFTGLLRRSLHRMLWDMTHRICRLTDGSPL